MLFIIPRTSPFFHLIFSACAPSFFLERPNLFTAALHALICALLINIRIPGVILPALTIGILTLELAAPNRRRFLPRPGRTLLTMAIFILLCAGLTIVFFPTSWSNPIQRFYDAYVAMTHRSWTCCYNLYLGQQVVTDAIPWHYVPVWMGVSTPIYYVGLFLIGLAGGIGAFFKRPWLNLTVEKRSGLIFLGAFLLPLIAIIIGRSVIYNGWRHLYFIYAPFLVIALDGFVALCRVLKTFLQPRLASGLVGLVTLISIATTAGFMVQNHPFEFVYFNFLAGRDMQAVKQKFELDYWGLSYIDGLRNILKNDPRPVIRVASNQKHMIEYSFMLTQSERDRLSFPADPKDADYFMTDYYLHPQDYDYPTEFYSIQVGNAKILSVFQLSR